jgi:hypothetical protein
VPADGPKIKVVARVWSWGQTASGRVLCRIAKADSGLSSPHGRRFPTTNSNPFTGSAPEQKSVRLRMLVKTRHAGPFRSEVANIAFVLNDNFSSPGRIIAALHLRIAVPIWGRRPASTQVLRKPLSSSGNGVRERFTKLLQSRLLRPWLMPGSEHRVGSPRLHGDVLSGAGRCRHGALTRGLLKRPIRLTSPLTPDAQRTY